MERAGAGETRTFEELLSALRACGVSTNGVLGDPTGAAGVTGEPLLEQAVEALGAWLYAWVAAEMGPA